MTKSKLYKQLVKETFYSKRIVWSFAVSLISLFALKELPSGFLTWFGFTFLCGGLAGLIESTFHPMGVKWKDRVRSSSKSFFVAFIGLFLLSKGSPKALLLGDLSINWVYLSLFLGLIGGGFNFDRSMERIRNENNKPRVNQFLDNQLTQENITSSRFLSCFAIKVIVNSFKPKQLQKLFNFNTPLTFRTKVRLAIVTYWDQSPDTPLEAIYKVCQGNKNLLSEQIDWEDTNNVWQMCKQEFDFIER
ncbi:hypothetical protein [Prochlorococcus sp. MIT 1223]|uniref:hypothetical protein n=1 Tax=Prochlorococcus sp. MIT 1223 TaxID=3096217 RepID=UPI002A7523D1|nr:hypothetical protein [Prochlorococcus sp. MIT 1223]